MDTTLIKKNIADIRNKLIAIENALETNTPIPIPTPTPAPVPPNAGTVGTKLHVWVYPGAPALDASNTYKNNKVDVIRVEYFKLLPTGVVQQINEDPNDLGSTKNAFSVANVKEIKAYSSEQLVTLSGDYEGLRGLASASNKLTAAVNTLKNFVVTQGLTGMDIDIEGFGSWTSADYNTYVSFLGALGTALHGAGKKLAVCGPNWTSGFDKTPFSCGWNWNTFVSLPIDYMTPMIYDWQWDYGGGTPVSPLAWIGEWSERMLALFGAERLVIGIPSYGYSGTQGKWDITILTLDQIKAANGYSGGTRDASSAEVFKTVGGKVYCSNDKISMNAKKAKAESKGVKALAVWHAGGGNDWF